MFNFVAIECNCLFVYIYIYFLQLWLQTLQLHTTCILRVIFLLKHKLNKVKERFDCFHLFFQTCIDIGMISLL